MKQRNSLALVVVLGLFFLQNTYSEEIRARTNKCTFALADGCPIVYDDSSTNRYVLWRIYTPNTYDSQSKVKVDSVLRENFYAKEEWSLHYYKMESTPKGEYKRHKEKLNLIPNTYYLVLATADCSTKNAAKGTCRLLLTTKDNFLPDTPENREFLSKKRDGAKIVYERKSRGGIGNIDETSTRKKKPDVEK